MDKKRFIFPAHFTTRLKILLGIFAIAFLAIPASSKWHSWSERVRPLDQIPSGWIDGKVEPLTQGPAAADQGRLEWRGPHIVLHLSGSSIQMGRQHGSLLKKRIQLMLREYIDPIESTELLDAAREMRTALPKPLIEELNACAEAADVDPDRLFLAQCIGDIKEAVSRRRAQNNHSCSAYVAFGPATAGGKLECGRNLDYPLTNKVARHCSLVTYYTPREDDGYRFAAIGMTGMVTGWTLVNEHGLIVANHLGGGSATRIRAIPTLLLARLVAQWAKTVDEGVEIIRKARRVRGQIIWLAQEADPKANRPARAVALEYDAERVSLREAVRGVLIVTNTNRSFYGDIPERNVACGRYQSLHRQIYEKYGRLNGTEFLTLGEGVPFTTTQHVVQVLPSKGIFQVKHRILPGRLGETVTYPLPGHE